VITLRVATVAVLAASLLAVQSIEIYRARYRPAAELVPIARSALGTGGDVTLDARTASLVLNGSPEALRRALALLEQVDRRLRQVVIETDVRQLEDLDWFRARVVWKASWGPLSIGTLPLPASGLAVGVDASRARETIRSSSRLRLLEGSTGIVRTGRALPVLFEPYWGTKTTAAFVAVDTGFEVMAHVVDDDQVVVELRPFAGRVDNDGELSYIDVATSVTVSFGETVVIAETSRSSDSTEVELSGVHTEQRRRQDIVLLTVQLDR
jgi:hypothetical protein